MKYETRATAHSGLLGVQIDRVSEDFPELAHATITRQVIDTYDPAVRAALMKLGWTPPPPGFIET